MNEIVKGTKFYCIDDKDFVVSFTRAWQDLSGFTCVEVVDTRTGNDLLYSEGCFRDSFMFA
jgi:hypothetical protein